MRTELSPDDVEDSKELAKEIRNLFKLRSASSMVRSAAIGRAIAFEVYEEEDSARNYIEFVRGMDDEFDRLRGEANE